MLKQQKREKEYDSERIQHSMLSHMLSLWDFSALVGIHSFQKTQKWLI